MNSLNKMITQTELIVAQESEVNEKKKYKWDIVWFNTILLTLLHIGALYGLYLKSTISYTSFIFYKVYGIIGAVGVTAGAHRLWSHRSYTANKPLQILLATMMSTTYQNSIFTWSRDHRLHHKYSETDADPHNAKRGFFFSHVGWLLVRKHKEVIEKGRNIDMSDLKSNSIVMFQHKYYYYMVAFLTIIFPMLFVWYFTEDSLKHIFFTVVVYRYIMSVNLTWCVNSLAHLYGKKPYNKNIGPTESMFTKYISWGEGFHNYHHTFPWDYKAAELGDEFRNLTYYFIHFFANIGWATELKSPSQSLIDAKIKKYGDGSEGEDKQNYVFKLFCYLVYLYLL